MRDRRAGGPGPRSPVARGTTNRVGQETKKDQASGYSELGKGLQIGIVCGRPLASPAHLGETCPLSDGEVSQTHSDDRVFQYVPSRPRPNLGPAYIVGVVVILLPGYEGRHSLAVRRRGLAPGDQPRDDEGAQVHEFAAPSLPADEHQTSHQKGKRAAANSC